MLNKGGFLPSDLASEGNLQSDIQNSASNNRSSLSGGVKVARCTVKLLASGECIDGKLSINNLLLSYVVLVGSVRHTRQSSNGMEITIEDGTGGTNIRVYQDKLPPSLEIWYPNISYFVVPDSGLKLLEKLIMDLMD